VARINEFVFLKTDGTRIWLHEALMEEAVLDALRHPDALFERGECRIIKNQRKIRIGRTALAIRGLSTPVYVKRYNAFSWRYKVLSLFSRSGALRSLRGAVVLARIGLQTGNPLAVLELRRWGLLAGSFYISKEIASSYRADIYWRDRLRPLSGVIGFRGRRRFLQDLAGLFRRLHQAGVYHNDLKDANILVSAGGAGKEAFYLLDLDGVRNLFFLSWRRRVKNLVQLNRTLGRLLRRSEKLYWLQQYLGPAFKNPTVKRRWLRQVLRVTRRADQRSRAKKNRMLRTEKI
jgi:serine/threonine protein kinase